MHRPFFIFTGGVVPTDTLAIDSQLYNLFAPTNAIPELILFTRQQPANLSPESSLRAKHGNVFIDFHNDFWMHQVWRLLRHLQLHHLFDRPTPREMAARIRRLGNPYALLVLTGNHDQIVYCARLLRRLPEVKATVFVGDDFTWPLRDYRNPLSKARVMRSFAYLLRRCHRRLVPVEKIRRYYEERFDMTFGLWPPVVRDDYFERFGRAPLAQPEANGALRVFLSGNAHGHMLASLQCLAEAFDLAAQALGESPKLVFCGTWTSDLLQQMGFAANQLEGLGWLASKREVLEKASAADCSFLPHGFDLNYEAIRWDIPSRTIDYLIAGPPLVAHALPESVVAEYFKEHGLPFLCEELDAQALAAQLVRVARLSLDEREAIRRRYLSVVERFHLASRMRAYLLEDEAVEQKEKFVSLHRV